MPIITKVRTANAQAISGAYLGTNCVKHAQMIPKNTDNKAAYFKVCLKPWQSHGYEIAGFCKYNSL
jgi:hypothetical protein